jgi:hypothetical protein
MNYSLFIIVMKEMVVDRVEEATGDGSGSVSPPILAVYSVFSPLPLRFFEGVLYIVGFRTRRICRAKENCKRAQRWWSIELKRQPEMAPVVSPLLSLQYTVFFRRFLLDSLKGSYI